MIDLTDDQRTKLAPLFEKVVAGNYDLVDTCIVAQVYRDGIVATIVRGDEVHALRKAWKAKDSAAAATARERMGQT
jgi:hypothetical protein